MRTQACFSNTLLRRVSKRMNEEETPLSAGRGWETFSAPLF